MMLQCTPYVSPPSSHDAGIVATALERSRPYRCVAHNGETTSLQNQSVSSNMILSVGSLHPTHLPGPIVQDIHCFNGTISCPLRYLNYS